MADVVVAADPGDLTVPLSSGWELLAVAVVLVVVLVVAVSVIGAARAGRGGRSEWQAWLDGRTGWSGMDDAGTGSVDAGDRRA